MFSKHHSEFAKTFNILCVDLMWAPDFMEIWPGKHPMFFLPENVHLLLMVVPPGLKYSDSTLPLFLEKINGICMFLIKPLRQSLEISMKLLDPAENFASLLLLFQPKTSFFYRSAVKLIHEAFFFL